jgi:post-segregation antitoxin (ccd killing protein)
MRQSLKPDEFSTAFTTKLPISLLVELKERAKAEGTTASALARRAIEVALTG